MTNHHLVNKEKKESGRERVTSKTHSIEKLV